MSSAFNTQLLTKYADAPASPRVAQLWCLLRLFLDHGLSALGIVAAYDAK
jgi:hypothetical protein